MTYNYDSAGDVTSYTHPAGFTVTQGIDVNQRPTSLTYGANMAVSNITYTGWGAISTMCGGQGCAQSEETRQYNNRLQPTLMELGNSSNLSADYSLTYSYTGNSNPPCTIPQGAGDNGNITGSTYTDNVNPGYSHTFTYCYDAVNRLTHAVASGSPAYDLMYSYDQYGNGTCVPGSGGGLCPAMSYNSTTNRLTSIGSTAVGYDAAGNQLNDIWSTYEYDAEGRVKHSSSSGQWQYPMYNALGQRVQEYQGTATDSMTLSYPIDIFGQRTGAFAQWPSQGWTGWNVYWSSVAGQRLNMGGASAYIDHADAVGSMTMETDPAGVVQWDMVHYPWGQIWQEGGFRQSGFFAGLDRQVNDPLIPSATRELSAALGRWTTPDPMGGDVGNPQSLNRYAYVLNSPCSLSDSLGLSPCSFHIAINGNGFLGRSQLNEVESEINSIFLSSSRNNKLPDLGATFSFSGPADYSLDVTADIPTASGALGNTNAGPHGSPLNTGQMSMGNILFLQQSMGYSLPLALAQVATHEAGHFLLQVGGGHVGMLFGSLMAGDSAKYLGNKDLLFSYGQTVGLESRCNKLRSPTTGGGGGGGAGGGSYGAALWIFQGETEVDNNGDEGPGSGWCPGCPLPPLRHRC